MSDGIRKGRENIDRRVKPFGEALIASLRKLLNLLLKDSSNAGGRVAFLELCSEWMREKVLLCASLIFFQGMGENELEVGRRCGRMSLRHYGRDEEEDSEFVMGVRIDRREPSSRGPRAGDAVQPGKFFVSISAHFREFAGDSVKKMISKMIN